MFEITKQMEVGKGFHITFANGYTVSVQWGYGNYCDHHLDMQGTGKPSKTAECAVFKADDFVRVDDTWDDDVKGYMTVDEVACLLKQVSELE